ncbi:ATP-binding protein [Dyadobacter sp. NIV53]|uniref:AAA family ATPase n=1 Tax=Dyadobacter sp. NIV53 TaxID=2861765 RepID=UPI001C874AAE|nr:ATP-binding protein [Dyadobacter sp. NIV53]
MIYLSKSQSTQCGFVGRILFNHIDWSPAGTIETSCLFKQVSDFNNKAHERQTELYTEEEHILKADSGKTESYKYSTPLQNEIHWLREICENNQTLIFKLGEINIELSNNPVLLLTGEAGAGKSHLLGDIALNRTRDHGQPFILLLGQNFKREKSIWENILALLDLSCTSSEFLDTLNQIGQQIKQRVVIAIDAINEGPGRELWRESLAGFIFDVKQYKHVALVISIRNTYLNEIIPIDIRQDPTIVKVTHEGFRGNEYFALQAFCKYYGISQPNFPLLLPEYSNPLFLNLICQGIAVSENKSFPQGYHGISEIFSLYKKAITIKLSQKRDEYKLRLTLFDKVLEEFSNASYKQEFRKFLPLEEAVALLSNGLIS